jgi:hypothetical protein
LHSFPRATSLRLEQRSSSTKPRRSSTKNHGLRKVDLRNRAQRCGARPRDPPSPIRLLHIAPFLVSWLVAH